MARGFGLDFGPAPKTIAAGLEVALSVPGVREDLRRLGAKAADKVYDEVVARVTRYLTPIAPSPPGPVPDPKQSWVRDVAMPVVTPFMEGFSARMKDRLRPVALIAAGAGATVLAVTFLLGRRFGRSSCP